MNDTARRYYAEIDDVINRVNRLTDDIANTESRGLIMGKNDICDGIKLAAGQIQTALILIASDVRN